jgi:hypothetical protein
MSHWFDRWTKRAAGTSLSRRELLTAGVASGLGVASRGLVGTALLGAEAFAQPAPPRRPAATRTAFAPVDVTRDGMTIRHELSFDPVSSAAVLALTLSRGDTLVAKVNANVRKDAQTVEIAYGPDVHGLKSASLESRDGLTFRGRINGRPFANSGPVASLDDVTFADRQPAPQVNVAQTLPASLRAVSLEVQAAIKTMKQLQPATQPLPLPLPSPPPAFLNQRIAKPAGNWVTPRSRNIPACDNCYDRCNDQYGSCTGNFDDPANFLCPPCWAARIAACLLKWTACMGLCNVPGGGCCPVPCGSITDNCCGPDTVCMEPKQRTCCPTDRALCGGFCCEKGTTTCAPDGFCGCPGTQVACGDLCCAAGDICSDEQCFQPSECTDGVCCHAPSHFCNGVCCPPFNACCNGVCCPNAGACINGQCCPTANRCGPACCANGQACLDPSAGVCGTPPACTPIQKTVKIPGGLKIISVPRFPCRTLGTDGRFVSVCCESGVDCCLGACCTLGRVCCIGNDGAACHFPEQCGPH